MVFPKAALAGTTLRLEAEVVRGVVCLHHNKSSNCNHDRIIMPSIFMISAAFSLQHHNSLCLILVISKLVWQIGLPKGFAFLPIL